MFAGAPQPSSRAAEAEVTAGTGGVQLLAHQRSLMQQQDESLGDILSSVSALRRTSAAIGEEVALQDGMLDALDGDVERTGAALRHAEQRSAALAGARSKTAHVDRGEPSPPATWGEAAAETCAVQ